MERPKAPTPPPKLAVTAAMRAKSQKLSEYIQRARQGAGAAQGRVDAEDAISARATAKGTKKTKRPAADLKPVHAAPRAIAATTRRDASRRGASKSNVAARTPRESAADVDDRIVVACKDAYWLHVAWQLSHRAIERTRAALGQDWYIAKPILRLVDVGSEDRISPSEQVVRDIEIHGRVKNWYVEIPHPPGTFRVDIGYLTPRGRFHLLAKSNIVTTPMPGMSDQIDEQWRQPTESEQLLAPAPTPLDRRPEEGRMLNEDRLRRPMSSSSLGDYGKDAIEDKSASNVPFVIDAELIVYGKARPGTRVTLQNEPVHLRDDGTFTMRFGLPEGRQILPAVAESTDGTEVRTVILAVERNTKELEPAPPDAQE